MHKPFRQRRGFGQTFRRLLTLNFVLCLCTLLVLACTLLPMLIPAAIENDHAYEENMLSTVSAELDVLNSYGESVVTRVQNSEWLYDLFIDYAINDKIPDIKTKNQIRDTLATLPYLRSDVLGLSFWFYDNPETLFSSSGVYEDISLLQMLFPESYTYQRFPMGDAEDGFSTCTFGGRTLLCWRSRFRDIPGGRDKGEIIIHFDPIRLLPKLREMTDGEAVNLRILSKNGETLWDCALMDSNGNTTVIGKTYRGYRYELDIPANIHSRVYEKTVALVIAAFLLDIVCSAALSLALAKVSYRPMGDVFQKYVGDVVDSENEFDQLHRAIERISDGRTKAENTMETLKPMAQQRLLRILLEGTRPVGNEELDFCGVDFPHALFNVVLMNSSATVETSPLMGAANMLQELLPKQDSCRAYLYSEHGDRCCIIVNYDSEEALSRFIDRLEERYLDFLSDLQDDTLLFFGIGCTQDDIGDICHAYIQAQSAARFGMLRGKRTTNYNEAEDWQSDGYLFPMGDQQRLSDTIAEGARDAACRQVGYIVKLNDTERRSDPTNLDRLYGDLLSTLVRRAIESGIEPPQSWMDAASPRNYAQLREQICGFVDELCGKINRQNDELEYQYEEIVAFIDENLYEPTISLESVAVHFGKSAPFVSTMFKRAKQMNYIEYVNRKRIEKAKELLDTGTMSMEEISANVGYLNSGTFRRNFQKYTGMMPSEYTNRHSPAGTMQ